MSVTTFVGPAAAVLQQPLSRDCRSWRELAVEQDRVARLVGLIAGAAATWKSDVHVL